MNILITGGTGAIGRALIATLTQESNQSITVLTRNIENAKKLLGEQLDYTSTLTLDLIEQQDVIINLAGEPIADRRWSNYQKEKICQSRWLLTKQLSALIQQAKNPPNCFISGSAIGMYGRQNQQIITESFTDYHPEFSHQLCQQWEQLALSASNNNNNNQQHTRVCLLRTGIVLNKGFGALKQMLPAFKLGLGGPMANGEQIMSWIDIEDMVNAIIFIIEHPQLYGAINMTAPTPVSNKEFSQTLAQTLHRPCLVKLPKWLLQLLFGEMADLLIYGQHVVPQKLLDAGFTFKHNTLASSLAAQT
ncbi:TIGR01777 family oxidoreductase [Thalassotalea sp. G2M2-11]|uniref:TIGR01777 family oxidoreductase n=1 Tax=Thalassotalea sp. G2M2-11 TaxID=2787627 RepID=UPI0019D29E54|nr:TIGR01777 family oxidoreductase [Thalassotalea sp. G2M2-11]